MTLTNKTLLITGIDEFIGLRAAEIALARGIKVRGLQTTSKKLPQLQDIGVELISGDVTNLTSIQKVCEGVDIVLHTVELAQEGGSLSEFRKINVDGSVNIGRIAKSAGVKTFVYLSSVLVYGFDYPEHVTEDASLSPEKNPYCQTKREAEQELLKLHNTSDFGVIIIRAGDVYGPGSIPWVARPISLMQQNLFAYADGGKGIINHVYIDNLIDAIFMAIEKEAYGEIFNITDGQETTWKDYFTQLAQTLNLPAPMSLPKDELKLFLTLRVQGQKLFRKKTDILPEAIDFMSRPYAYSTTKAKNILGYEAKIDLEKGMQITKDWLKKTDLKKIL